jgi:hypothetical protein
LWLLEWSHLLAGLASWLVGQGGGAPHATLDCPMSSHLRLSSSCAILCCSACPSHTNILHHSHAISDIRSVLPHCVGAHVSTCDRGPFIEDPRSHHFKTTHRTDQSTTGFTMSKAQSPYDSLRHISKYYDNTDSHKSALNLILTLRPEWRDSKDTIEFVRFTDGITNTVRKTMPCAQLGFSRGLG